MGRKKQSKLDAARRKDLDETRRLLYMAKCIGCTEHYELAGTLINTMRHHQGNDDPQLEDRVIAALNEDMPPSWLLEAIESLTTQSEELG